MTEIEKLEAGLLYNASQDPDLLDDIRRCEKRCFDYNRTSPDDVPS